MDEMSSELTLDCFHLESFLYADIVINGFSTLFRWLFDFSYVELS